MSLISSSSQMAVYAKSAIDGKRGSIFSSHLSLAEEKRCMREPRERLCLACWRRQQLSVPEGQSISDVA